MRKNRKDRDFSVLRTRSSQAVLVDGYKLYSTNFSKFFLASWPVAVVYALAMGVVGWYFMGYVAPLFFQSHPQLMPTLAIMGGIIVVFLLVAAVLASTAFDALYEHRMTGAITRPKHWYGRVSVKGFIHMLRVIGRFVKHIGQSFDHLGMVFAVLLTITLVTLVLSLIAYLPLIVVTIANLQAQADTTMGDPIGLPSNIGLINFITFTLVGFIQAYIHLSTPLPLYYVWGHVCVWNSVKYETRDKKNIR